MTKFTVTQEINCNQDKFWSVFFDKSAMSKLHIDALGYREYTILEQTETDSSIIRKAKASADMYMECFGMSGMKAIKYRFIFTEDITFDKATKICRLKRITIDIMKTQIEVTIRVEPIDSNKIRCIYDTSIGTAMLDSIAGRSAEDRLVPKFRQEMDMQAAEINKIVQAS